MSSAFLQELFEVELVPNQEAFTNSLSSSHPFSLKQLICMVKLYLILELILTEKSWSTL